MSYINHYPGIDKIDRVEEMQELSKKIISIDNRITVLVVATSDLVDNALLINQLNASGVSYINKAGEVSPDNFIFRDKLKYYIEALKDVTTPYALLLDVLDVVILKDLDSEFLDIFESYGKDIIYNATPSRFPRHEYYKKEPGTCMKFLNAGVCIGRTKQLIDFYNEAYNLSLDGLSQSEQHYIKMAWQDYDNVGIDSDATLFTCHHKIFHTLEELMNTLSTYKPTKLFYTSDQEYYDCFLSSQSMNDVTLPENVSIVLTDTDGYLVQQLERCGISYYSIDELEDIHTEYVLVTPSSKSIFVHSLDDSDIERFAEIGKDVLFGSTSIGTPATDYEHKRFILQCMASDVMFGFTDAVKELFLNHTEENTFEQIWLNNKANIDIDTYEDIITCCTYNDTTITNGKIDHHVEYPWIKKEDGFHYIP